jgi:cell division initiation protein
MVTAQRISEDVKATARKEAEVKLAEADLQAEKIVAAAHNRVVEMKSDIAELKRQRAQFEAQVEQIIEAHRKLLETFRAPAHPETPFLFKKTGE